MTYLVNDPSRFPVELADGFLAANRRYVRKVFGGAVRATESTPGKVSLIVGGEPATTPLSGVGSGRGWLTEWCSATSSPHPRPLRRSA